MGSTDSVSQFYCNETQAVKASNWLGVTTAQIAQITCASSSARAQLSQLLSNDNIKVVYIHERLTMNGIRKYFIKKVD